MFGGYSIGAFPALTLAFVGDILKHAILPALSIILVAMGSWALTMRGTMVTTHSEDYVSFAEAKGLKSLTIFLRYCLRNAMLPQTTALALSLGQILCGGVLVEVIFAYPGIGTVLYHAIRENDHFLIQGIVFSVIVAPGVATLLLDLLYPWLDPRITYRKLSMGRSYGQEPTLTGPIPGMVRLGRLRAGWRYMRRNMSLVAGLVLLFMLVLFVGVGQVLVDGQSRALSAPPSGPHRGSIPLARIGKAETYWRRWWRVRH
jgi:hypothetical protein